MNKVHCFILKWLYAGKYTKESGAIKTPVEKGRWTETFDSNGLIFLLPEVVESDIFEELFLGEKK